MKNCFSYSVKIIYIFCNHLFCFFIWKGNRKPSFICEEHFNMLWWESAYKKLQLAYGMGWLSFWIFVGGFSLLFEFPYTFFHYIYLLWLLYNVQNPNVHLVGQLMGGRTKCFFMGIQVICVCISVTYMQIKERIT